MKNWDQFDRHKGELWPFEAGDIKHFADQNQPGPRGFVNVCAAELDAWMNKRKKEPIRLGTGLLPPLADLFVKEWEKELATIQQAAVSPENIQEDRLFRAVSEAIKTAAQAKLQIAGAFIQGMSDGGVGTAKAPRPSLTLQIGPDGSHVVVAASRVDAGPAFAGYVNALDAAMGTDTRGVLLVRPSNHLKVGPTAAARKKYDEAVASGKLRPFALMDEMMAFRQLECLCRFLENAGSQNLQLAGQAVSEAECRKLIIETKLLDHLKLFEFVLTGWAAGAPAVAAPAVVATPVAVQTTKPSAAAAMPKPAPTTGKKTTPPTPETPKDGDTGAAGSTVGVPSPKPTPAAGAARIPPAATPAPVAPPKAGTPQAWADGLLAQLVEQLRKWGQPVAPAGVEIGPTFARFKVCPQDQTDVNKVRNKADNLRVRLSLTSRPRIAAQAGYISIDVQRPDRQSVPLQPILSTRPEGMRGQPAFPVGVDVSGKPHWLNMADPATCHLLVAGTTGSGKSEFMKAMLAAMAAALDPGKLTFILIDPKRVTFNFHGKSPYMPYPIAHDSAEAMPLVERCVNEMEKRYKVLEKHHLQNISELPPAQQPPRVVLVFDEFADLMVDKVTKKELETHLKRLGAKARAAGIHLVLGTQRTEASVVTPLLRSNLPGRISLAVTSDKDSKLILEEPGAADLLGRGDLLWRQGGNLLRLQSPLVEAEELEAMLRIAK